MVYIRFLFIFTGTSFLAGSLQWRLNARQPSGRQAFIYTISALCIFSFGFEENFSRGSWTENLMGILLSGAL